MASRGSTCRTFLAPMGDENVPSVRLGNIITARPGEGTWCQKKRIIHVDYRYKNWG